MIEKTTFGMLYPPSCVSVVATCWTPRGRSEDKRRTSCKTASVYGNLEVYTKMKKWKKYDRLNAGFYKHEYIYICGRKRVSGLNVFDLFLSTQCNVWWKEVNHTKCKASIPGTLPCPRVWPGCLLAALGLSLPASSFEYQGAWPGIASWRWGCLWLFHSQRGTYLESVEPNPCLKRAVQINWWAATLLFCFCFGLGKAEWISIMCISFNKVFDNV